MKSSDGKKYIYAFLITAVIFLTALAIGEYLNTKKFDGLKTAENQIAIDILSSEVQFALLGEVTCPDGQSSIFSDELNSLGEKLNYSEEKFGTNNTSFIQLKKQYSLLEIKDYLLMKKLKECKEPPVTILYFYGDDCPDCDKEGYVLTHVRQQHPKLRVYSFDYNIDLSAVKTLASIYGITKEKLPALVIKNKLYAGFQSVEDVLKLLPELATSTKKAL